LGLEQAVNPPPSREQENATPLSASEKPKDAVVALVGFAGWVSTVGAGGATVSTVQVLVAGVGSVLEAGSVARTAKVWDPWASEA